MTSRRLLKHTIFWTLLLSLAISLWPQNATAQFYFGKNKVQYTYFDWLVLSTERFDIYFYESERWLAEIAATAAEESYDALADRFNHRVAERIPLIIYSSPRFFGQTNIIPSLLPENVAGFTEFVKGRVALPFNGSYADFRRVLQHELVHVFTGSKLATVNRAHKKLSFSQPPLWFTEGIAEFYSRPWQSDADMIISDLVLSGQFLGVDQLDQISGTYLMYKEGESFCHFIDDVYGAEYLVYILDNWWRGKGFDDAVAVTFGKPLYEIGTEWEYWLKKKYFPTISVTEFPDRVFTQHTRSGYNLKPVPVQITVDGRTENRIVFMGNRLGYGGLYMVDGNGDPAHNNVATLLKAERSSRFESLHLMNSSFDVSADGVILFSSKRHDRDVLYLLDLNTRRIVGEHRFDSLYSVSSPSFAPDGRRVVFSGAVKNGIYDLFLYDLEERRLTRLTDDCYLDTDPVFTPDGADIVFASDRGHTGEEGRLNLYRLNRRTGGIVPYFTGRFNVRAPSFAPDGSAVTFTCDERGHSDIYTLDTAGTLSRLTQSATGLFNPRYRPDGNGIVFAAYQNTGFQIYEMALPDSVETRPVVATEGAWQPSWEPVRGEGRQTRGAVKYHRRFAFDLAQSAVSYDAFYGTVGGFQTAMTDVLGDHQYYFLVANNADSRDELLESFSAAISYFNREHRLNYGYGAFHLNNEYSEPDNVIVEERLYGMMGSLAYPLSKFRRVEASLFLRRSDRTVFRFSRRRAILATQFISLVHDNSLWDVSGPIDGWRLMLTFGYTADMTNLRSFNRLLLIDGRKYFRLGRFSALATRVLGHFSSGLEPQRRYLGGSWDLRGWPRRGEYARNVLLFSNELRFPLIDALFIGMPVARLGFRGIRGALFFDAGNAWDDEFGRMKGALGVGARVSLGYFAVLRFDWARRTDFRKLEDKTRFEFFFGWNF
ncbi:MAG TPA: BamA/TamA family outer membrane protein [Acidobacteriota bacterium]|nr:BamA/TamA family outer membrane protein [Acidobacteriota bacterium]